MLHAEELIRYQTQMCLPNIGKQGQQKLKSARVLCVGLGGLGTPLVQYLTSSGIGTLGLMDGDHIEASNIARQLLYHPSDVGKLKIDIASSRLASLNPFCDIQTHPHYLQEHNALKVVDQYDFIADCSDNFATRYLLNDACVALNKPYAFAAVQQHQGQLAILNRNPTACFRCLFDYLEPTASPTCQDIGILPTTVGLVGLWQCHEIIKALLGLVPEHTAWFLRLDLLSNEAKKFHFTQNPDCPCCVHHRPFNDLPRPKFCTGLTQNSNLFVTKSI